MLEVDAELAVGVGIIGASDSSYGEVDSDTGCLDKRFVIEQRTEQGAGVDITSAMIVTLDLLTEIVIKSTGLLIIGSDAKSPGLK